MALETWDDQQDDVRQGYARYANERDQVEWEHREELLAAQVADAQADAAAEVLDPEWLDEVYAAEELERTQAEDDERRNDR